MLRLVRAYSERDRGHRRVALVERARKDDALGRYDLAERALERVRRPVGCTKRAQELPCQGKPKTVEVIAHAASAASVRRVTRCTCMILAIG